MKQKSIIKVLLILAVILIGCSIKTTSYAMSYAWSNFNDIVSRLEESSNNSVELNKNALYTNPHVFCIDRGNILTGDSAEYKLEQIEQTEQTQFNFKFNGVNDTIGSNPISLPGSDGIGDELAYLLYQINQKEYAKEAEATSAGPVQQALWCFLDQYSYESLSDDAKKIYNSAIAYGMYRDSIRKNSNFSDNTDLEKKEYDKIEYIDSNIDYINVTKSNTDLNENLIVNENNVGAGMGPFQLEYARAWHEGIGFGTLTLKLTNENGEQLNKDQAWFYAKGFEGVYEDVKETIITTAEINAREDFYIRVNLDNITGIKQIKLQISTEGVLVTAKVWFIDAGNYLYDSNKTLKCMICNDSNTEKEKTINTQAYIVTGTKTYLSDSSEKQNKYWHYSNGKLESLGDEKVSYDKVINVFKCKNCSYKSEIKADLFYHTCVQTYNIPVWDYVEYYVFTKTICVKSGCGRTVTIGKTNYKCGDVLSSSIERPYQKLILQDSEIYKETDTEEITCSLIPTINLDILKMNATNSNQLTGDSLTNLTFNVTATQDTQDNETLIINSAGLNYTIIPNDTTNDILVKIEETTPPDGYGKIATPIKIKYSYSAENWIGTIVLQDGWEQTGMTYISDKGDKIVWDEGRAAILIYDDKIDIEKLTLLKIDAETQKTLLGAKFSGTISNIKSFAIEDGGARITEISENEPLNLAGGTVTFINGTIDFENIEITNLKLYDVVFINKDSNVVINLTESSVPTKDENYYYKKLDKPIKIILKSESTGGFTLINFTYEGPENVTVNGINKGATNTKIDSNEIEIIIPNERLIDITGQVWLDGQTGIKPASTYNGKMDKTEAGIPGVIVELLENGNIVKQLNNTDAKAITGNDGTYSFTGIPYGGNYTVRFTYDGINYEDTIYKANLSGRLSDAQEIGRDAFNDKFKTITYKASNSETLEYDYIEATTTVQGYSVLKTTNSDDTAMVKYQMKATTEEMNLTAHTSNIDLGLVKRGTDLALSTYVTETKVTINGEETIYYKNQSDVKLPERNKDQEVSYNSQNLFTSDYNYRIRDYVNSKYFSNKEYTDNTENSGNKSGDELEVYVTYELLLLNQSTKNATIDLVEYKYDSKYEFVGVYDENNNKIEITPSNNIIKITGIGINGTTEVANMQKLYKIVFKVLDKKDTEGNKIGLELGDFYNTAEIMSYSTEEGLIDVDSQPGNYNDGQPEDDSHKVKMTISIEDEKIRTINGYVYDDEGNKVNDVIVQLIEVKEFAGKLYEYIWQETVSGSNTVKKLTDDGTNIETYTNSIENTGEYEFQGFIPGNYIVRFIYGDGSTYDLTDNVIKYNGQDYKSVVDTNYNKEWYDASLYTKGASVARDNEARRLETMAYSANVDTKKGVLLKLLDTTDISKFNETEKQTLKIVYEDLEEHIEELTSEELKILLKFWVLPETWMCAETSKINITVDDKQGNTVENINLGLTKRPETKIELKKYITGFRLKASNGQVLVNAYMDVNKAKESGNIDTYLTNLDNVNGIKDNLVLLDTVWQYEVSPTEVNTLIDGASLEFDYTLVVRNIGEQDLLSKDLTDKYESMKIDDYVTYLKDCSTKMKESMKLQEGKIGTYLGSAYYTQNKIEQGNVKTDVTNIIDYVNLNLDFINGKDSNGNAVTVVKDDAGKNIELTHNILRDDYSMQEIKVNYLQTAETGKMAVNGDAVLYTITLGDDVISSTGTMSFENYIAEVMSYTNAAGRRATSSTPGNAEIIDHEKRDGRAHEIDEAATARIQIGVETGEDKQTNYIVIATIAAGIAVVIAGVFVTKKYFIK